MLLQSMGSVSYSVKELNDYCWKDCWVLEEHHWSKQRSLQTNAGKSHWWLNSYSRSPCVFNGFFRHNRKLCTFSNDSSWETSKRT